MQGEFCSLLFYCTIQICVCTHLPQICIADYVRFVKKCIFHSFNHANFAGTNMGKNAALQQARFTGVSSCVNLFTL